MTHIRKTIPNPFIGPDEVRVTDRRDMPETYEYERCVYDEVISRTSDGTFTLLFRVDAYKWENDPDRHRFMGYYAIGDGEGCLWNDEGVWSLDEAREAWRLWLMEYDLTATPIGVECST